MNKLIETSAESKAKKLFTNPSKSGYIKTFAIFTANNPDAEQTTRKNNISLNKGLKRDMKFDIEKELNNGYWSYYKVKGKYGNVENSFIIYNITLTDAKELSAKYHQQSFIYGTNEEGKLTFAFYANRSKSNYDYVKVDEKDSFNILDKDAENYYTQISRDFKFSISFDVFEVAADQMIEELDERKEQIKWSENDIVECIKNSLEEKKTNTHKYQLRATLKNKNKDKTKYTFMADPEGEAAFFNNAMGSAVAEDLDNKEKTVVINIDFPNIFNDRMRRRNGRIKEKDDFDAFIINAGGKLLQNGYEIVDEHWSNNEDSLSYYIEAIKKNDINKSDIKVILFIRLSDHSLNSKTDFSRNRYYNKVAQDSKKPDNKNNQDWEFINIVSQGHSVEDYANAIKKLKDTLSQIETSYYMEECNSDIQKKSKDNRNLMRKAMKTIESKKNTFKFKLVESIDEKVKLHYDDLLYEIAVDFDKDTNAYSYEEKHNPFDYEVDKEKVIDVLYDICIGKKEFDNYSEEEIEDHIRNNFNNVLKTYYTDVLNEFEEDAKQKAEYDYYEEQENVYYDSLEEDKNNTTQKDKSKEFSVFEDIKTGLEQAIDYEKAN